MAASNPFVIFFTLQFCAFLGLFYHWRLKYWSMTPRPKFLAFLKANKPYVRISLICQVAAVWVEMGIGTLVSPIATALFGEGLGVALNEISLATTGIAFGIGILIDKRIAKFQNG